MKQAKSRYTHNPYATTANLPQVPQFAPSCPQSFVSGELPVWFAQEPPECARAPPPSYDDTIRFFHLMTYGYVPVPSKTNDFDQLPPEIVAPKRPSALALAFSCPSATTQKKEALEWGTMEKLPIESVPVTAMKGPSVAMTSHEGAVASSSLGEAEDPESDLVSECKSVSTVAESDAPADQKTNNSSSSEGHLAGLEHDTTGSEFSSRFGFGSFQTVAPTTQGMFDDGCADPAHAGKLFDDHFPGPSFLFKVADVNLDDRDWRAQHVANSQATELNCRSRFFSAPMEVDIQTGSVHQNKANSGFFRFLTAAASQSQKTIHLNAVSPQVPEFVRAAISETVAFALGIHPALADSSGDMRSTLCAMVSLTTPCKATTTARIIRGRAVARVSPQSCELIRSAFKIALVPTCTIIPYLCLVATNLAPFLSDCSVEGIYASLLLAAFEPEIMIVGNACVPIFFQNNNVESENEQTSRKYGLMFRSIDLEHSLHDISSGTPFPYGTAYCAKTLSGASTLVDIVDSILEFSWSKGMTFSTTPGGATGKQHAFHSSSWAPAKSKSNSVEYWDIDKPFDSDAMRDFEKRVSGLGSWVSNAMPRHLKRSFSLAFDEPCCSPCWTVLITKSTTILTRLSGEVVKVGRMSAVRAGLLVAALKMIPLRFFSTVLTALTFRGYSTQVPEPGRSTTVGFFHAFSKEHPDLSSDKVKGPVVFGACALLAAVVYDGHIEDSGINPFKQLVRAAIRGAVCAFDSNFPGKNSIRAAHVGMSPLITNNWLVNLAMETFSVAPGVAFTRNMNNSSKFHHFISVPALCRLVRDYESVGIRSQSSTNSSLWVGKVFGAVCGSPLWVLCENLLIRPDTIRIIRFATMTSPSSSALVHSTIDIAAAEFSQINHFLESRSFTLAPMIRSLSNAVISALHHSSRGYINESVVGGIMAGIGSGGKQMESKFGISGSCCNDENRRVKLGHRDLNSTRAICKVDIPIVGRWDNPQNLRIIASALSISDRECFMRRVNNIIGDIDSSASSSLSISSVRHTSAQSDEFFACCCMSRTDVLSSSGLSDKEENEEVTCSSLGAIFRPTQVTIVSGAARLQPLLRLLAWTGPIPPPAIHAPDFYNSRLTSLTLAQFRLEHVDEVLIRASITDGPEAVPAVEKGGATQKVPLFPSKYSRRVAQCSSEDKSVILRVRDDVKIKDRRSFFSAMLSKIFNVYVSPHVVIHTGADVFALTSAE